MATLLLMRQKALTDAEIRKLPPECVVVTDSQTIVARADVELPLPVVVKLAVAMGRAVPDASFAFHEKTARGKKPIRSQRQLPHWGVTPRPENESQPMMLEKSVSEPVHNESPEQPEEVQLEELSSEEDIEELSYEELSSEEEELLWWQLLEARKEAEAMEALAVRTLDVEDRELLKRYLNAKNTDHVAFVCRAARQLKWRSLVITLRRSFHHSSPKVRAEAVTSVGELAGPSMSPAVHLLLNDPDEKVRKAAQRAYKKLRR